MSIRFVDDDDRLKGEDIVGRYLAKKYIADIEKREEEEKKKKDKTKGPKTYTGAQICIFLCATAPFVGMGMMLVLTAMFVKWAEAMKALAAQL